MKQKTTPLPFHLQSHVDKETNKPIQSGHFKKKAEKWRTLIRISDSNNREERRNSQICLGLKSIKSSTVN